MTRVCKNLILLLVFFITLAADLISKLLVVLFGKPLSNPGVAFSMFADSTWAPYFFMVLNILVAAALLHVVWRGVHFKKVQYNPTLLIQFGLVLIASGALGNALDRIFHLVVGEPPYVVDFIYYPHLFTGNIADIAVVLGAIITAMGVIFAPSKKQLQ